MAENFKLPGSSYEEFVKIIKAYATGKVGIPMSLDAVAQTAGMDKTIVSRNNGFLVQLALISDGNKKSPTQEGLDLGRAYTLKMNDEIVRLWIKIIEGNEFLNRMLSAIRIRNSMEKTSFVNHILYSSGASNNNNTRAGASTIIEIYKVSGLVEEQDGKIIAVDDDLIADVVRQQNSESINSDDKQSIPVETIKVPHICSDNKVVININIDVKVNEIEELSEKIKGLIESIK